MRRLLDFIWQEWKHLQLQIEILNEDLGKIANSDAACVRSQQIPGVGRWWRQPWSRLSATGKTFDLLPVFRTSPSMISDEGKGKGYVEEQAHGSADDRGAEATRGGS